MNVRILIAGLTLAACALPLVASADSSSKAKKPRRKALTPRRFARIELGRRLFFDPQVSRSQARSCASCHAPDHGWSDPSRISEDDAGETRRHSQTILNSAFNPSAHWDGEFATVEDLVVARIGTNPSSSSGSSYGGTPPSTPRDPGKGRGAPGRPTTPVPGKPVRPRPHGGGLAAGGTPGQPAEDPLNPQRRSLPSQVFVPASVSEVVAQRINENGRYREAFQAAYGNKDATIARIARAIGAFTHSVESTPSALDRYKGGDESALTVSAKRGLDLFLGRAKCATCHIATGDHPQFTDYRFHNTGIAWDTKVGLGSENSPEALRRSILRKRLPNEADFNRALASMMDGGRLGISRRPRDLRAFKTPTLRDVSLRGPYMHDGRFGTLHEVVSYYAKGCGDDRAKDKRLKPFEASSQDINDLVAFLESLEGETRAGLATKRWSRRARNTTLRFVDANDNALKSMKVSLVPVGDEVPGKRIPGSKVPGMEGGDDRIDCVTSRQGTVRFAVGLRTHMRVVLPEEMSMKGGELIPDTCKDAKIVVPVSGRMTFVITFGKGASLPEAIIGRHDVAVPAGHPNLRTRFTRGQVAKLGDKQVARYEGWARTDAGVSVRLLLPGQKKSRDLVFNVGAGREIRIDLTADERPARSRPARPAPRLPGLPPPPPPPSRR